MDFEVKIYTNKTFFRTIESAGSAGQAIMNVAEKCCIDRIEAVSISAIPIRVISGKECDKRDILQICDKLNCCYYGNVPNANMRFANELLQLQRVARTDMVVDLEAVRGMLKATALYYNATKYNLS